MLKKKLFVIEMFEETVEKYPDKHFLLYEDQTYTYKEANECANKMARVALSLGLQKGSTIALMQHNSPEFVWTFLDAELIAAVDAIIPDIPDAIVYVQGSSNVSLPSRFVPLESEQSEEILEDINENVRAGQKDTDACIYIFTSGTTGLPKAASVPHRRLMASVIISGAVGMRSDDVVYITTPLYHSGALVGALCSAICHGATIALARKFSSSNFWKDVRRHQASVFFYIGELCRYLLTNEKTDQDREHAVRLAFGNGLRQDIYAEFKNRFGVPNIAEFYASTEGVAGFVNLFNVVGSCDRSSPFLERVVPSVLFQWDVENESLVRDESGHCIPVKQDKCTSQGKPGLLLMQIIREQKFDGYRGSKEQSESKIVRNVRKDGDVYFNTGDLMYKDKATMSISATVLEIHSGQDGRAGMATLLIKPDYKEITAKELSDVSAHCNEVLPVYAIPIFLRIKWEELDMTSTIKQTKVKVKQEGFDFWVVGDPMFYYEKSMKTYKNLTKEAYEDVMNHIIRF